ncbi:MAG: glycosyltransferase [Candidatus Methanomethylicia archaeon]
MQEIKSPSLIHAVIHAKEIVKDSLGNIQADLLIANPSVPFYIAHHIAKEQAIPLILRIWGVRANKLIDHIIYGKNYLELVNFYPSIAHNLMQIWASQAVVVMDDATKDFLSKLPLFRKLKVIYPTYAALYDKSSYKSSRIQELIEERDYVFSFVTMSKTGSVFRLEQQPLFRILYMVAKKCPEINTVIAGGTASEARRKFRLSSLPKNLIFVGGYLSDNALKMLYANASLVVIPIFFKSVSNRLLESLFYGKPILTNSFAKICHNRLEHLYHVYISDRYDEYSNVVKEIIKDDILLEELSLGARTAYRSFFSSKLHGLFMKKIIRGY